MLTPKHTGHFGAVFRARLLGSGCEVAAKVLKREFNEDDPNFKRVRATLVGDAAFDACSQQEVGILNTIR